MNAQEHKLLIGMLATQLALTSKLVSVLRENGSIQEADEQKIWRDVLDPEKQHFLTQVSLLYQGMASRLGLNLDLGDFPPKASR